MKTMYGPTFGDTLNGRTVINVHGEETRLITAREAYSAPDLLAALEAFDKDHGHTMSMPRERCPYCVARAALRKAKGE